MACFLALCFTISSIWILVLFFCVVLQLFYQILIGGCSFLGGLGNVHRKLLHNIWFLSIVVVATYLIFHSLISVFGIIIGFISHLIADSFTVTGVYWLYPTGRGNKKISC